MARPPHPKKEVEEALGHAEGQGWRVEVGGSHAWGRIYCPYNDEECRCGEFCITSVMEHAKEPRQPRTRLAASCGQLHHASQAARG